MAEIDDGGELRGGHFKYLLHRPWTWILIGVPALAVGGGLVALRLPAYGVGGFLVILLIGAGILFKIASRWATEQFFEIYAERRGMGLESDRSQLPEATPLLSKGENRYADRTMHGPLGEGFEGTLAHYTYEEEYRSKGSRSMVPYPFTIVLLELPECVEHLPELYCQPKFGFRALEGLEDVFRVKKERVELESEVLDREYEIFSRKGQDPVWLRRLLAPSFIVWLTDAAPKGFGFELVDGTLCAYVNRHKDSTEDLDEVASASVAVAKRLREEVAQTSPRESSPTA